MLKRLTIQHFKSIEHADISFDEISVFVGNNGSGKSNIVDAIRFLKDVSQLGLDRAISDRHGIESVRQWSPTRPFRISLGIEVGAVPDFEEDSRAQYNISIESGKGQFHVVREEIRVDRVESSESHEEEGDPHQVAELVRYELTREKDGAAKMTEYRRPRKQGDTLEITDMFTWFPDTKTGTNEFNFSEDEAGLTSRTPWQFASLRRHLANFQGYSIYPNTLRIPQEPSSETFLTPEGRNVGSVFKRMRKTKRGSEALNSITEAMKALLPNLERISVLSVGGYLVPQFHMLEATGKRHIFNVSQMSDGSLRILGLLTALYQDPRPSIIALEEPEQTVNPGILPVVADAIKEVSKTSQVIITTHSPHLLDQFDPGYVRPVDLVSGKTTVGVMSPLQTKIVRDRLFSLGELLVSEGLHS